MQASSQTASNGPHAMVRETADSSREIGQSTGASSVKTLHWADQNAVLNYRIGDVQVGALSIPIKTPTNYFWEMEEAIELDRLLPTTDRGILLRSLPVPAALPRFTRRPGSLRYVPRSFRRYLTDVSLDADRYLAGMSGKSRNTLKRKVRKYAEAFGPDVDFREYKSPEQVDEYFANAWRVSRLTYQERLLAFGLPDDAKFVDRTRERAIAGDWRGYVLFARNQPIAYVYCPIREGVALYAYVGFDPEFSEWSPGTVLQWLILQRMFPDPEVNWFDFTEGEGPHKEFFSTHSWLCADVWVLRPSIKNWTILLTHAGLDLLGVATGRILHRINLKKRVRRLLRRQ